MDYHKLGSGRACSDVPLALGETRRRGEKGIHLVTFSPYLPLSSFQNLSVSVVVSLYSESFATSCLKDKSTKKSCRKTALLT